MHAPPVVVAALLLATGCQEAAVDGPETGDESDDGREVSSGADDDAWFDVGWGETQFNPVPEGGELRIVWGSQGAAMYPMPVRGGGFVLPNDPRDYGDEKAPLLDLEWDIEGYNDGFGGHFKRIANYPMVFEILDDGSYEFIYVAVLVPDGLDPRELDGLPTHLRVVLRPFDSAPLEIERNLVVALDAPP